MALGIALSVALMAQAATQPVSVSEVSVNSSEVAAQRADVRRAIAQDDPAQLISMGVALARSGDQGAAMELLNAAAKSETRYRLETADGRWMDSRRLALKVIGMIDGGEFAPVERVAAR